MLSNIIEIIILSLVQGISEFLPISSSSHLIIVSTLYQFKSSSLLIDVSLHLGSLFAIIFFFRKEFLDLQNNQRLLALMTIGSAPIILIGYILYSTELIYLLRDIKIIAWTTLIFGIILYIADKNRLDKKIVELAHHHCKTPELQTVANLQASKSRTICGGSKESAVPPHQDCATCA